MTVLAHDATVTVVGSCCNVSDRRHKKIFLAAPPGAEQWAGIAVGSLNSQDNLIEGFFCSLVYLLLLFLLTPHTHFS